MAEGSGLYSFYGKFSPVFKQATTASLKKDRLFKTGVRERRQVDSVKSSEYERSPAQPGAWAERWHGLVSVQTSIFFSLNFCEFPLICSPRGVPLGTKGDGGTAETKARP